MGIDVIGLTLVIVGLALLIVEFTHPGALLLIPGSVLLTAGLFYTFLPSTLLDTPFGVIAILLVAIVASLVQLPYYRWIAPNHRPMTTTSAGFAGRTAVVVAPIIPHSLRGKVRVDSEVWSARAESEIGVGTKVRVVSGEGVSLLVVPLEETHPAGGA